MRLAGWAKLLKTHKTHVLELDFALPQDELRSDRLQRASSDTICMQGFVGSVTSVGGN